MKKYLFILLAVSLLVLTACDTELVHMEDENHDHDNDGIQDHAPEEHEDEDDNHTKTEYVDEKSLES